MSRTLFGIFLTPVFYYVIQWFSERRTPALTPENGAPTSFDHGPQANGTHQDEAALTTPAAT